MIHICALADEYLQTQRYSSQAWVTVDYSSIIAALIIYWINRSLHPFCSLPPTIIYTVMSSLKSIDCITAKVFANVNQHFSIFLPCEHHFKRRRLCVATIGTIKRFRLTAKLYCEYLTWIIGWIDVYLASSWMLNVMRPSLHLYLCYGAPITVEFHHGFICIFGWIVICQSSRELQD